MSRLLIKLGISAGLVAWLLWRSPLGEIASQMSHLGFGPLLAGAMLSIVAWVVSGVRLWLLAPEFPFFEVIRMSIIASFYSTVLPGQVAGDVMKAWRLSDSQKFPGHAAAATIVDRGIAMLTLLALGATAMPRVGSVPTSLGVILAAACAGVACVGYLLSLTVVRDGLIALTRKADTASWPARIFSMFEHLAHAVHDALRRPRRIAICFLVAFVFHALCVCIHLVIGHALGIGLTVADWCVVYASVSVLLLLPLSIAGIGLREGGYVGILAMFGVSSESALALSFTFFAYTLLGALLGLIAELTSRKPQGVSGTTSRASGSS